MTQVIPFELVDSVLAETGRTERRLRVLPSRVGVYFVLALGLFGQVGVRLVWQKLICGLAGLAVLIPSEKALRDLRRRIGAAPLKALFETLAVPLANPFTPGTRYRRWRTVAMDGCGSLKVPDHERNRGWLGKLRNRMGPAGYPTLTDHRADPAAVLVQLYHERWEIESAFFALRHTLLRGRVLRSKDPVGVEQEVWALLTLYQALRHAMVTAVETRSGADPDRASFTIALEAARVTVTTATGIVMPATGGKGGSIGHIATAVLTDLLPPRRARFSARIVKAGVSRYGTWNRRADDNRPATSTDSPLRGSRHPAAQAPS